MKDKRYRDPERYRLHAEVCRVLTDPKRLMILDVLRDGERSVGDLAEELGCTLANASQHLAVLRSAGLVGTRRTGTTILYDLAEPELVEACDVIHRIVARRLASLSVGAARPASAAAAASIVEAAPVAGGAR
jgi:ArsR family transcriptional regulator